MAKAPTQTQPDIDDEADYDLTLKGVAIVGRMRLLPRDAHIVRGAALRLLLAEQPDAVESYQRKD